jgi:polysaccharide export outer membrane protein
MQFGTPVPWEVLAQGEYIGPHRLPHVPEYRLRVDDVIEFVFRLTGQVTGAAYRLNVGDVLDFESLTASELTRQVIIQPDGTITLRYLGQVRAEGRTVDALRQDLDQRYRRLVHDPNILITPIKTNTTLEELRATVDSRAGSGGQSRQSKVTPEGTVQLPAIGSVPAQGLTLDEMKREIDRRYAQLVHGISVTPILIQRAPRFVYVVGEVRNPGRYTLEAPTSTTQAIALAGGWNVGGNLRQVVVFRRTEVWKWRATKLDMRPQLLGKTQPCFNEIWIRDSDIVVVPKHPILVMDDLIELVFTRGIYGVVPFNAAYQLNNLTVL